MADYKISLGVELDTSDIATQIRRIATTERIDIGINLDTRNIQTQINNIRRQIQELGNITINLGGNGNGGGRGNGGGQGRRQVDEVTQAYRDLMGVLNELNSKRRSLNGLIASSPQSSQQIQTLRRQIEQLNNEYNSLLATFNRQGIQFTADQWNQIETTMGRVGRQIEVVQSKMSDSSAVRSQTQAYRELMGVAKEIDNLEINLVKLRGQGGNSNQIAELENQLRTLRATYQQLVTTMDTPLTNEQWSSIYTQFAQTQDRLEQLKAKYADIRAECTKKIELKLADGSFTNQVKAIESSAKRLSGTYDEVENGIKEVNQALVAMQTASANNDIEGLISANERYEKALKTVKNQLDINKRAEQDAVDLTKLNQAKDKLSLEMSQWLKDNTRAASQFGVQIKELQAQIESADSKTLGNLKAQFTNVKKQAELAGKTGLTFVDKFKEKLSQFSAYFSVASLFMWTTQALRSMFEQVKSIDTAMTELKKVTDETDASYNKFLTNAASRAKEIGTTIDGLVESTADFARLGYGFEDAQGLAEVANIYAVVGDEVEGVEGATESLISTMAAFKDEMGGLSNTDFAMSIIDIFNEIGNNFAISSGGLGEALERSASSLAAANNTLQESAALITAANTVTQDPEKVGNAMKTISMRIRGATTE